MRADVIPVLDGQLEIPTTVLIPEDLDTARRQLTALDGLATASEWARAAIVAAWVVLQDGPGGIVNSDNGLTTTAFAELGIAGLKSPNSVRRYRLAWGDRPRPTPGEPTALPADPFPKTAATDPEGDDWYTPSWIFELLGLTFDVDVCAPADPSMRTCPASRYYTPADDGLTAPWSGLVWCNPPYSDPAPWVARMIEHDDGILLAPFSHKARWTLQALHATSALRWIGWPQFIRPNGDKTATNFSLMLAAFGDHLADALNDVDDDMVSPVLRRAL